MSQCKLTHIDDIIQAVLPEDLIEEIPSGFTTAGHVGEFGTHEAEIQPC